MRVALLHHQYKLKGGMESYFFNLIKGFNQCHDEITAYVYRRDKKTPLLCSVKQYALYWLPRVLRKYYFGMYISKKIPHHDIHISLMRAFNQDMIICGGTHLGFLKKTRKKPGFFDKLEIAVERKSYHTARFVIAHSNLVKQELIHDYHVSEEKIVLLFPPLDVDHFTKSSQTALQLKRSFGLDPLKKSFLFPSTGHKRKGLDILIEAMAQLPQEQFELVIAGDPPKALTNNIKYVGFIKQMSLLYQACDATILPSYYEPFGLVVIESLQSGTPVIVSNQVGAKDLITEKEGIVLDSLTPEALAKAMITIVSNKYSIDADFAIRHELTIQNHIDKIKLLMQ